jgi:hypothetical protein
LLAGRLAGETPSSDVIELPDHECISVSAYRAGRADAEKDIQANCLIIEVFGLPTPWDDDYARIFYQKYDVEVKKIAGDVVDYEIVGHAKGYNEVSKPEIQRRFGSDVLEKTQSEVHKHWQENHAK